MNASSLEPRSILLRIEPNGLNFSPNIFCTKPGIPERGDPLAEWSVASQITSSKFIGAISDQLGKDLFVEAYYPDIDQLGDFSHSSSNRLEIVSSKFKDIIESFDTPKSEFIPIKVSLLADGRDGEMVSGGGAIVSDAYWLWNCYNWLDLIVESASERPTITKQREYIRGDLPGNPVQSIRSWGSAKREEARKLSLRTIDYATNPFFRVVGIQSGLFVSPQVTDALDAAGLLAWQGGILVAPTELDTVSPPSTTPMPFNVFGTDVLISDYHSRPFAARIPTHDSK